MIKSKKLAGAFCYLKTVLNLKHMKQKTIIFILLAAVFISLFFIITKNLKKAVLPVKSDKLQIVASFYPLYFFATEIGGEKADVTNIVPAGAEPHDYEPTPQDVVKMENSRLIILNGGGLETWKDNIQKNINPKKTEIVVAGESLATQFVTENGQTGLDPHIWLSPVLAQELVDKIAQSFAQVDPANKDYYNTNANALKNKLTQLDTQYRQGLNNCAKKDIITAHAAFGYLASAYDLRQVSIAGLSLDAEPSSSQLANIAKFARDNNAKYIFFESLASPKLSETIATEVGAQTLVLNPIEGLSEEDLSAGKNYLTVMQDNLTNLRTALECQ